METTIAHGIEGARSATGVVVVIDVLRAFTTAAYAFDAGIKEIELVATVEEAFAAPGFRMGEVGGRLIQGFDHNNSPSLLAGKRFSGRAVQRTGSGTRCVAAATGASEIWLGSLVVASATARALAGYDKVTFVASGSPDEGEEDVACAEWIAALLHGTPPSADAVAAAVRGSRAAVRHLSADPADTDFPAADLDCALSMDKFGFAMKAVRRDGRIIATRFFPGA